MLAFKWRGSNTDVQIFVEMFSNEEDVKESQWYEYVGGAFRASNGSAGYGKKESGVNAPIRENASFGLYIMCAEDANPLNAAIEVGAVAHELTVAGPQRGFGLCPIGMRSDSQVMHALYGGAISKEQTTP